MHLTPCEKRFLEVLESYEGLLPDGVHIDSENRKERVRRELTWHDKTQVDEMVIKMVNVILGLNEVVEGAVSGGMRQLWVENMKSIINDVTEVLDFIHDAKELKLH